MRIITLGGMNEAEGTVKRRIRKNPEERRREILDAAARLIAKKGYYGTSLRDIADAIGMSQPGLLHYIGAKENLLSMLITDDYDLFGTPDDFFESGLPGSDPAAPLFPAYLRYLVQFNSRRGNLMQLYMMLETESFDPEHPLHDYFDERPEAVWDHYSRYPWRVPPQLGTWEESMRPVVRQCIEIMDGIQLRWFRDPPIDMYEEWLRFEDILFPSPLWDRFR